MCASHRRRRGLIPVQDHLSQSLKLAFSTAQARRAQEAEEAAERARVAEVEARRVAAQVQAVQTRQLRDAVFWLRNSAKWPKESMPRCASPVCDSYCCECACRGQTAARLD